MESPEMPGTPTLYPRVLRKRQSRTSSEVDQQHCGEKKRPIGKRPCFLQQSCKWSTEETAQQHSSPHMSSMPVDQYDSCEMDQPDPAIVIQSMAGRIMQESSAKRRQDRVGWIRTFFRYAIEEFYPSTITVEQLGRLDQLLMAQTSNNRNCSEHEESIQKAFRMSTEQLLDSLVVQPRSGGFEAVLLRADRESFNFPLAQVTVSPLFQNQLAREDFVNQTFTVPYKPLECFQSSNCFVNHPDVSKQSKTPPLEEMETLDELNEELVRLQEVLAFQQKENEQQVGKLRQQALQETANEEIVSELMSKEVKDIRNRLRELSVRKNVVRGLIDRPVNILNHFKLKSSLEEHRPYHPNLCPRDLMEFLAKKQIRKNKKTRFPLATSCLGCFSDFNEDINPIDACYECGARLHQSCRQLEANMSCSICEGKRNKKIRIRQCILCPNRGLAFRKCGNFNVHVFCILLFGYYTFKEADLLAEVDDIEIDSCVEECFSCGISAGKLIQCSSCERFAHPSCCYLSGYMMSEDDRGPTFDCSYYNTKELALNRFNRLYRANRNKLAFKFVSYEDYARKSQKSSHLTSLELECDKQLDSERPELALEEDIVELVLY